MMLTLDIGRADDFESLVGVVSSGTELRVFGNVLEPAHVFASGHQWPADVCVLSRGKGLSRIDKGNTGGCGLGRCQQQQKKKKRKNRSIAARKNHGGGGRRFPLLTAMIPRTGIRTPNAKRHFVPMTLHQWINERVGR